MITTETLLALPVLLPLAGAAVALLASQHRRLQILLTIATLVALLAVSLVLAYIVEEHGILVLQIGNWTPQLGIVLVADRLAVLMLAVSAIVTLAVLVYSSAQAVNERAEKTPVAIYHPTYLVLVAGVSNAFLAGDLFNLYVGFEIFLAASYVLLTLGGSASRIRAATTYVIVSLISAIIFLAGVAAVYAATGTVNLALLAVRLDALQPDVRLMLELVLLVAFAIKAAIFPLSAWLPDSYPTAPAPVTAVFASLLTKVGIYAIIRLETLLFPASRIQDVLLVAGAASLLIGILGALAQTDLKRVLSFVLVSHMGYMMFGIGISTRVALGAVVFYVVHHIIVQSTLFLVAGLIEQRTGTTNLARLGGLLKTSPVIAALYFLPAMNVGGIPPLSGFIGKVALIDAGIRSGTVLAWVLVGMSVLVSLLTLYAVIKIWNRAFLQVPPEPLDNAPLPRVMVGSTAAMVVVSIVLTGLAGPLIRYSDDAGAATLERTPYVRAVLGDDAAAELRYLITDDGEVGAQ